MEVDGTYTLAARDSGLVIQIPGRADIVLQPVYPDAFAGTVHASGARGLRFDQLKR